MQRIRSTNLTRKLNPQTTTDSIPHLYTLGIAYLLAKNAGLNTAGAVRKCARRIKHEVNDAPTLQLLNGIIKNPADRLVSESVGRIVNKLLNYEGPNDERIAENT